MLDFEGRLVAVSGVGLGFGKAIAENFASRGARVHGCDINGDRLGALRPAGIATQRLDLTDRAAGAAWIGDIEASEGRAIDVLVNNLGGLGGLAAKPIEAVPDADWDHIFAINLGPALALTRAAVPGMKRAGRGAVVNLSSGAGLQPTLTGNQAYCAAKHAVIGLTRQLAHELGPFGIRVNSVAPGFVITSPDTERQWAGWGAERQAKVVEGIALRRLGTAEDIANAVLFFASPLAAFVTGQVLQVDGGK